MSPGSRTVRAFAAFAACVVASCGDSASGHPAYALFRNLSLARELEVVLPAQGDDARLRSLGDVERVRDGRLVHLRPGGSAARGGSIPRIVIADARTAGIGSLLDPLELRIAPDQASFTFLDTRYDGPDDVIVATFADPARRGLPVTLYFGLDAARAASFVRDLTPTWRPAFRCFRGGLIEREGRFRPNGDVAWSAAHDELQALAKQPATTSRQTGLELVEHGSFEREALESYRGRLSAVHSELQTLFDVSDSEAERATIRVHLWASAEALALATGSWSLSCVGPAPRSAHAVLAPQDDDGNAAARAWARELLGEPAQAWMLEGLGAHVAKSWWGKHLAAEWLPYLMTRGLVPDVQTLVSPQSHLSPHLRVPLRGALFGLLLERDGARGVRDAWRGLRDTVLPSDADLLAWIESSSGGRTGVWRESRHDPASAPAFRRGLHLTPARDDDGRAFRGLGTRACETSLRGARELGANALVLAPYAYLAPGFPDWPAETRDEPFDTSTPDVALATAAAQSLGMHVMFAPQLLTSRSGTWAGWTMIESGAEFERFFEGLQANLTHYALLAELCNADLFSVGSELARATRSAASANPYTPDYLLRASERWRTLIASSRKAFRGALTYSALGLPEAQAIDFWGELDYVGVGAYLSLGDGTPSVLRPDDDIAATKLHALFRAIRELAESHGRPALISDIGFAPTSEAWLAPDYARGALDLEEQRRLLAATAEALRRHARSGEPLAGLYLSCWSTDPTAGRDLDRSFTPQNRPALAALAQIFGRP